MKILEVAWRAYPAIGGAEVHVTRISEELVKKGHQVTLAVFNSRDPRDCGYGLTYQKPYLVTTRTKPLPFSSEEMRNGVRILRFESFLQMYSYYWSPKMLAWLLNNSGDFDIVHTHVFRFSHNEFVGLAHLKNSTPFILTAHDKLKLDYMGQLASTIDDVYRSTLGRILLRMANKVIAFGSFDSIEFHTLYGVPFEKIAIIPNGIDFECFVNLPDGSELLETLNNPDHVVLYLGRFIDYKKPDLLISSFPKVLKYFPNSHLLMVGKDFGLLHYCKELVKNLRLEKKVTFIENASEEMKLTALSIADMCVIPSIFETFPLVALEAAAAGVPVIARNVGGLQDIVVNGKTGILLNIMGYTEIAEEIVDLLSKNAKMVEMQKNAKLLARNFSWEKVTEKLTVIYKEALK
jgi:glycogen synthase